ncbi:MAG: hypothetical protein K6E20_02385 [Acholeplasmatales bacterium]|nr:hypothetical protein [Acholeplasmatales bacterium]
MSIQYKIDFDDDEIKEDIKDNSLYKWCLSNSKEYLLDEWDYEKNGKLTPKNISFGCDEKVWWKLNYHDEKTNKNFTFSWKSTISHRTQGRGCPYLSYPVKKIYTGFNDLATTNPNLMSQWDYEKNINVDPTKISSGSTKKVWWLCDKGHSWDANISSRVKGAGCPYCAGKKAIKGYNDLATTHPDLVKEWDYKRNKDLKPTDISYGSIKKVWWLCPKCKNSYLATPNARTCGNTACPICEGLKVEKGYNDLATLYPDVTKEWNYDKNKDLTPYDVVPSSNKKVWWICKRGHEWQAVIHTRTLVKTGCPKCQKEKHISYPEKIIAYYLSKHFNIEENKRFDFLNKAEIDIYISEIKTGIEYDGFSYHRDILRDYNKDLRCKENGIRLIRIREPKCPIYETEATIINTNKWEITGKYLADALKELLNILDVKDDIDIVKDQNEIMQLYLSKEKENSIINTHLIKDWDYEKNKNIDPSFISYGSNRYFYWKCQECGFETYETVNKKYKKKTCTNCGCLKKIQ